MILKHVSLDEATFPLALADYTSMGMITDEIHGIGDMSRPSKVKKKTVPTRARPARDQSCNEGAENASNNIHRNEHVRHESTNESENQSMVRDVGQSQKRNAPPTKCHPNPLRKVAIWLTITSLKKLKTRDEISAVDALREEDTAVWKETMAHKVSAL